MDPDYPSSYNAVRCRGGQKLTQPTLPLTILVGAATLISIASVIWSAAVWQRSRSNFDGRGQTQGQKGQAGRDEIVCLPRDAVVDDRSSFEERMWVLLGGQGRRDGGSTYSSKHSDVYCARDDVQLELLLRMFLNVRNREENKQDVEQRPSCLLYPSEVKKSADETLCILDKMENANAIHLFSSGSFDGNTFLWEDGADIWVGPVERNRGKVLPNSGGIYYVYSQAYLNDYGNENTTSSQSASSENVVTISISRHSKQTNQTDVVAEHSQQRCPRSIDGEDHFPCEYSLSAGSLVELTSGDALSVAASHPAMVNPDSKLTYFGFYEVT